MFSLKREHKNGFDTVVLEDNSNNTSIEIIPDCGAMLRAFTVKEDNVTLNIIDSYLNKAEYDTEAESKGFKGLKLSPFPCRIQNASYSFNGTKYKFSNNLVNGSAIHGLLYNKSFVIIEQWADDCKAFVFLLYKYKGDNSGYPFSYDCEVIYSLQKHNRLTVQTNIKNTGKSSLPVADGWHPYFTFHRNVSDLELQFNSTGILEFVNLIPTGAILPNSRFLNPQLIGDQEIDNSFLLDFARNQPVCILRDRVSGWQLEITPDLSYPYLQIYIPPHRNSIAIENLSAPPDSFNNKMGLVTLPPGGTSNFTTTYRLHKAL